MGAAIWSCPIEDILKFPAKSFFEFWKNHSLLTVGKRPTWKTVKGGSSAYIKAFLKQFPGTIKTGSPVKHVRRNSTSVSVHLENNEVIESHYVIIATHADQALRLLESPTTLESELLGVWQYSHNTVILHTDPHVMPPQQSAWSSWLVQKPHHHNLLHMTYYMNRLQNLNSPTNFFVTLNELHTISTDKVKVSRLFTHPIYDNDSVATQSRLHELNTGLTRFCGSYFGYGFHEDGVRSAVEACKTLGVGL
jgi:predicted NAD/FAD-binding protein